MINIETDPSEDLVDVLGLILIFNSARRPARILANSRQKTIGKVGG